MARRARPHLGLGASRLVLAAVVWLATAAVGQAAQLTVGSGGTFSLGNVTITASTVSCTLTDGTTTQTSTCLKVNSAALPDHAAGPWSVCVLA